MRQHKAFWKFFLTYFISVALLILSAGYFYFEQTSAQLLKLEHFSMLEVAKKLKMHESMTQNTIQYSVVKKDFKHFSISNFKQIGDRFIKYIPKTKDGYYYKIEKSTAFYLKKFYNLKRNVIIIQLFLLMLFALISYLLAKNALKPLERSIVMLDTFSKDLIHDLNTPVTSMLLNLKLLQSGQALDQKILNRLQSSAQSISTLHSNLNVLLKNSSFNSEEIDISGCIADILSTNSMLYPDINVKNYVDTFRVSANETALRQVLSNIISNAFKYNRESGSVTVRHRNRTLIIKDTGVGIKDTHAIFERNYKEQKSGIGIGLDITKRLCDALKIDLEVVSSDAGSQFSLHFN